MNGRWAPAAAAVLLLGASGLATGAEEAAPSHAHPAPVVLAPGWEPLQFRPPAPGSYRLPPLFDAADGAVVDLQGRARRLHEFFGDRLVVLSFIFTRCSDVNGCPLASHVLAQLQRSLSRNAELARQVRLVSISFDPGHDTPAVLRAHARSLGARPEHWQFLTSSSESRLAPLLSAYDQWVIRQTDDEGRSLGNISHLLRVYLIDRTRRVRNIYSVTFLHHDTVQNDLQTLLLEERDAAPRGARGGSDRAP